MKATFGGGGNNDSDNNSNTLSPFEQPNSKNIENDL